MYYPYSENKGADQLRGYREAVLRLCFRICKKKKKRFSHDAAHFCLYRSIFMQVRAFEIGEPVTHNEQSGVTF